FRRLHGLLSGRWNRSAGFPRASVQRQGQRNPLPQQANRHACGPQEKAWACAKAERDSSHCSRHCLAETKWLSWRLAEGPASPSSDGLRSLLLRDTHSRCRHVPVDHPLEKRGIIAECRRFHTRNLAALVPLPNPDRLAIVGIATEFGDFARRHRTALELQRGDGSRRQLVEIAGIGCAEIAFGGDVEANTGDNDGRKKSCQHARASFVM